jgi:hypothetical protein
MASTALVFKSLNWTMAFNVFLGFQGVSLLSLNS